MRGKKTSLARVLSNNELNKDWLETVMREEIPTDLYDDSLDED